MNQTNKYILPKSLLTLLTVALFAGGSLATPILDQSQELFTGRSAVFDQVSIAQTFTPAITGQLDHVDLYVCDKAWGSNPLVPMDPHYPATISIRHAGTGGAPTGALLGHVDVDGFIADTDYDWDEDGSPDFHVGWNSVDFLAQSVFLNAGSLYAIVITNDDPNWEASPTDTFLVHYGRIAGSGDPLVDVYEPGDDRGILWERDRTSNPTADWQEATILDYDPGYANAAFKTYMVPEPALTAAPPSGSSLDFGSLLTSAPDPTLASAVTLSNTGDNGSTIDVLNAVLGGADPGLFDISLGDVPTTLTAGADAWEAYDLSFLNPGISGLYSATLTFNTSEGSVFYNLNAEVIPEPAALLLLLPAGLVLLLIRGRTHRTRILCISPVQSKPGRILRAEEKLKMIKTLTTILTFVFALAFALHADVSKATPIDPAEARVELDVFIGDPGDVELYVLVRADDADAQLVYFEFRNESNDYCSIEGIYFHDGSLLGIPTVVSGPGTAFSQGATPGHLPGGNQFSPPFITHAEFLADSDAPPPDNGVEPVMSGDKEWVQIIFGLEGTKTVADVIDELDLGSLRIGVHVIGFDDGASYSGVNPEPATLILLAAAAGMAVFFRKSPPR